RDSLQRQLKIVLEGSVAFWRRVSQAEGVWQLALTISAGLLENKPLTQIMAPFMAAICTA
ncbi:MAG: hypothetical protein KC423_08175, partial [Anaerolineales bacterium]|nr:hypothetical protein [Anaerolineales bacterium]